MCQCSFGGVRVMADLAGVIRSRAPCALMPPLVLTRARRRGYPENEPQARALPERLETHTLYVVRSPGELSSSRNDDA